MFFTGWVGATKKKIVFLLARASFVVVSVHLPVLCSQSEYTFFEDVCTFFFLFFLSKLSLLCFVSSVYLLPNFFFHSVSGGEQLFF